ncbi:hypothetical protein [Polyangium mundeleinium]|uniref:DUF4351 domain-containing protein n=1 Tax=Polyangium mundeleinium TaxID=2995306 RepID=A0ABT5F4N8_9BACT|nr:hypothetical protein [Polyangium mundeleinium]MDC0748383.1 hypothetical protein [Polyangium mundeleinium]
MPSLLHEAIIELFRNRPVLAAELLHEALHIPLPPFTEARIASADLTNIIPRELRADLLVLLLDDQPVLVIIVEAQLPWDADKPFAWPAYVAGARARYRCPACLLVVTPDGALAARLSQPIVLGPGQASITPLVLGPEGVPVVKDIDEAKERPELSVLSALAHGRTEGGISIAVAALAAGAGLDAERAKLYADLVLFSLGEAARTALEKLMSIPNYEYQSEFARKYVQQGREEGRAEGSLEPVLRLFERRLARPLTSDERENLATQLRKEGATRLTDMALDLSAADLAALLVANNGR